MGYSSRLIVPRAVSWATLTSFPFLAGSGRVSPWADGAGFGRPYLDPSPFPLEWGRSERAEKVGARLRARPRGPRARGLRFRSAPGPGSGVPALRRPLLFLQALRSSAGRAVFAGTACGRFCSPSVLGGCMDPTHTGPFGGGDNRERSGRARRSPNARHQPCLGSAVRSAKCLTQKASGAVR